MGKKIVIADDHGITRMGLKLICEETFSDAVVIECSSIKELKEALLRENHIDLLILDNFLGDTATINCLAELKEKYNLPKTLMVSLGDDDVFALRAIKEGAHGYINKMVDAKEIRKAISDVIMGDFYLSSKQFTHYINYIHGKETNNKDPFKELSDREFQIALYLIQGLDTSEISIKMDLKPTTVSTYKGRVYEKLNIVKEKELWDLGRQYGLIH